MKLAFAVKVFLSCTNIEQMATTFLWVNKIGLSSADANRFIHLVRHAPDFDLAVQQAKNNYHS